MKAFMFIEGIKGQSTDETHEGWIILQSISSPIIRTIKEGAVDVERTQGSTTLGNLHTSRIVDVSTVKLAEYCANGKFIPKVEIHLCNTVNNKNVTFMSYTLENVIITSHSVNGTSDDDASTMETVDFNCECIRWVYTLINPKTGSKGQQVVATYRPGGATA